jgi:hexulose-6-phosphate isomerase
MREIGFMQGRLSELVNGKIQAFPWSSWQEEFIVAERNAFQCMEWTLDQNRLHDNPLMTLVGQKEILTLSRRYKVSIPSVTGDCFMQAPFWKAQGAEQKDLQCDFQRIAEASAAVGISIIVVPLVDNGRLDNMEQEDVLVDFLENIIGLLMARNLRVAFESDFTPMELARFIARLDSAIFGINYDIGNSAASGFNPADEIAAYGDRIINVHVKDRLLGGTTVPLGMGSADFKAVFKSLALIRYEGNCILQTARAIDSDHAGLLCRYRDMTIDWLNSYVP